MKRIIAGILWILSGGCILNDVPNPVIYGNVTKIEFDGQESSVINTKTRTIELTLSDMVDIYGVRLNVLELSADPARAQEVFVEAKATIAPDTVIDLSKPFCFKVRTYQEYEWTIIAEQPIDRYFTLDPEVQVGDEVINVQERQVTVFVKPDQSLSDIWVEDYCLGSSIATYDPDPYDLTDFTKQQVINVTCFGRTEEWKIVVLTKDEEEGEILVDAWAKFANVSARIPSGVNGTPAFEYKQDGRKNWTRVEAEVSGQECKAKLEGLTPNKKYAVRCVVGDNVGEEVTFSTERAEQVPYSNFDTWYMRVKNKNEYGTPGIDGVEYWSTSNEGGASFNSIPTKEEKSDKVKGSACRLTSEYAVMKFAAGSVYTGKFGEVSGTNADLYFGIPYTCRPTKLKGYYKYNGAEVNRVPKDGSFDHLKGLKDSCHILIALCDWKEAFHAFPPDELADYSRNNREVLAYGELKDSRDMDSYEPFTIDIEWRDTTRKPTYIVIVASSSKYGDYFAGGEGSTLFIDEFELGFD